MDSTSTKKIPSKEKWIEIEHQKHVQIHWDNIARIKPLQENIDGAIRSIALIEKSKSLLEATIFEYEELKHFSKKEEKIFAKCDHSPYWDHDSNARCFAEDYLVGISELKERQKQLCLDVAKWQAEIDTHTWDDSVKIMHDNTDKEKLEEAYYKLYPSEKAAQLEEVA